MRTKTGETNYSNYEAEQTGSDATNKDEKNELKLQAPLGDQRDEL